MVSPSLCGLRGRLTHPRDLSFVPRAARPCWAPIPQKLGNLRRVCGRRPGSVHPRVESGTGGDRDSRLPADCCSSLTLATGVLSRRCSEPCSESPLSSRGDSLGGNPGSKEGGNPWGPGNSSSCTARAQTPPQLLLSPPYPIRCSPNLLLHQDGVRKRCP